MSEGEVRSPSVNVFIHTFPGAMERVPRAAMREVTTSRKPHQGASMIGYTTTTLPPAGDGKRIPAKLRRMQLTTSASGRSEPALATLETNPDSGITKRALTLPRRLRSRPSPCS